MAVDAAAMAEATGTTVTTGTESTPSTDAAAAPAIDIWAEALKLDPDELVRRYPALQGKIGSLAQQQSQRAQTDWLAQQTERQRVATEAAERQQLRDLAARDPDALAAKIQTDLITKEYQESQTRLLEAQQGEMSRAIAARLDRIATKPIVAEIWAQATPEVRTKMDWRNYQEIDDYFDAINEITSDYKADKKAEATAEKLLEKRQEALKKEGAIEAVKADAAATGSADLGLDGQSTGDHIYSVQEIRDNMHDAAWRKANMTRVNAQNRQGLIRQS